MAVVEDRVKDFSAVVGFEADGVPVAAFEIAHVVEEEPVGVTGGVKATVAGVVAVALLYLQHKIIVFNPEPCVPMLEEVGKDGCE